MSQLRSRALSLSLGLVLSVAAIAGVITVVFACNVVRLLFFPPDPPSLARITWDETLVTHLYAVPGGETKWVLHAGESINGLWRSTEGVTLALESEDGRQQRFTVVAPEGQNWGEKIRTGSHPHRKVQIQRILPIPTTIGAVGTTQRGTLRGGLDLPVKKGNWLVSDGTFYEKHIDLEVQVEVSLVSQVAFAALETESKGLGVRMSLAICGVAFTTLLGLVILTAKLRRKNGGR